MLGYNQQEQNVNIKSIPIRCNHNQLFNMIKWKQVNTWGLHEFSWHFTMYLKYVMSLLNIRKIQNRSILMIISHSITSNIFNPYNTMNNPKLGWRYLQNQKKRRLKYSLISLQYNIYRLTVKALVWYFLWGWKDRMALNTRMNIRNLSLHLGQFPKVLNATLSKQYLYSKLTDSHIYNTLSYYDCQIPHSNRST